MKTPKLFPENKLKYLEIKDSYQKFEVDLIEKENNLMVFANFWVDVDVDEDGDDFNIPQTTEITSAKIFDLSLDIYDENGYEVEDENDLIYNEVFTFLKEFYEK